MINITLNKDKDNNEIMKICSGESCEPKKTETKPLSAEEARKAAAEAAAATASAVATASTVPSTPFLFNEERNKYFNKYMKYNNKYIGYYDPKLIEEYKLQINNLIELIKELNNKTQNEYKLADEEAKKINAENLKKHTELAKEYLTQIKSLKIDLDELKRKLSEVENAEILNADQARKAAEEAANILKETKTLNMEGGSYDQKLIDSLKSKIIELNKKTAIEYEMAKVAADKIDKVNLDKHTDLAKDYLNQIKKLLLQLKAAEESNDDQFKANNGPAAFPGQNNPNNKFADNDYVIPTGSSKPEKQKFIGKTGKILNVLEAGVGKNTSKMTRYDVDFGKLGQANFKESRLIMGKKEDYKSNELFGGGMFYEKYMKYKDKYLRLKSKI